MAEVIEAFLAFVRDNTLIVLGIMVLGVVYLLWDREMTLMCPQDDKIMQRVDHNSFMCPKCGFVKRV